MRPSIYYRLQFHKRKSSTLFFFFFSERKKRDLSGFYRIPSGGRSVSHSTAVTRHSKLEISGTQKHVFMSWLIANNPSSGAKHLPATCCRLARQQPQAPASYLLVPTTYTPTRRTSTTKIIFSKWRPPGGLRRDTLECAPNTFQALPRGNLARDVETATIVATIVGRRYTSGSRTEPARRWCQVQDGVSQARGRSQFRGLKMALTTILFACFTRSP